MAIRIVWRFFSSPARGISHFFTNPQNTQPRRWKKKKRTSNRAWASSKCKRREVCDTFVSLSAHLQATADVYLSEKSTQPLGMLTPLLALVSPASVSQQVLAAAFLTSVDWSPLCPTLISWQTCFVDWSILLPSADCVLLLTDLSCRLISGTFLASSFWSRRRCRAQALCVGFASKQTKLTGTHTYRNGFHHRVTQQKAYFIYK